MATGKLLRQFIESGIVGNAEAFRAVFPTAKVSTLEVEIGALVYTLYGLTKDEIKLVETSAAR